MKLKRLYTESIAHLDPGIQESLLSEAPHCRIDMDTIPADLPELARADFIDLGLENQGFTKEEHGRYKLAFYGTGLAITQTKYRIRFVSSTAFVVEPADGTEELTLPKNWLRGAYTAIGNTYIWLGKGLRPEQIPSNIDWTKYQELPDGWLLNWPA